jgi:AcrR family transcriptional regulator
MTTNRFKPRKRPVQARSEATVGTLLDASIQVLLAVGYRKLTTTRVAERAGVSVGSLYQYFPNRQALIAAVVERYLAEVFASIEASCRPLAGGRLEDIATGLVDAFVLAKWKRIDVSRAMHEPLSDVGGLELVQESTLKGTALVADLLSTCSDASFDEAQTVAMFVVTGCSSLLQTVVAGRARSIDRETLRMHMRAAVLGYLRETCGPTGRRISNSPTSGAIKSKNAAGA